MSILDRPAVAAALASALAPTLAVEHDGRTIEAEAKRHDPPTGRAVEARLRTIAADSADPAVRALFSPRSMSVRVAMRDDVAVLTLSSVTHRLVSVEIGTLRFVPRSTTRERMEDAIAADRDRRRKVAANQDFTPRARRKMAADLVRDERDTPAQVVAMLEAEAIADDARRRALYAAGLLPMGAGNVNDDCDDYI